MVVYPGCWEEMSTEVAHDGKLIIHKRGGERFRQQKLHYYGNGIFKKLQFKGT